ncbi:hypothetical protein N7G274_010904 [Stereocaulon virgatum]|uniref:Signal recognition particle subunit SRP72 n=1 Tax=Stereocaulon virgatum TaxID=373712 RepID=A0ABR3ZZ94_9LECA
MSTSNKKDPSTQYLLYKVALRSRDPDLATECLDTICNASDKDATLLYACVLEAQQVGDQSQMVTSLQRVLQKYDYSAQTKFIFQRCYVAPLVCSFAKLRILLHKSPKPSMTSASFLRLPQPRQKPQGETQSPMISR